MEQARTKTWRDIAPPASTLAALALFALVDAPFPKAAFGLAGILCLAWALYGKDNA